MGSTVGVAAWASDADGTDAVSYSLDDDAGGRFAIDALTGQITVAGSLDRESAASFTITVRATSTDASWSTCAFTISLLDIDEFDTTPISDQDSSANAVAENAAVGTSVGVVAGAVDADATNNTVTYSLVDDDNGRFVIDSATGEVTVGGAIDRETLGASRQITVRSTSTDGSASEQVFSIVIEDVDEFDASAVIDANPAADGIAENSAIGTAVGIVGSSFDGDATNSTITYSLADDDGGRFTIDGNSGVVTLAATLDREADGPTRTILIRAVSADGSTSEQAYSISIYDVDEFDVGPVGDADPAPEVVDENASDGTVVGIVANATDADSTTNMITYSLEDSAGGRFAIDPTSGVVTVAAAGGLDFEANASHSITVRATSADGSFSTRVFSIAVNDINEFDVSPISDADGIADSVAENSAAGTCVGVDAYAVDQDGTHNLVTYALTDSAGGSFQIDASSGMVTVAPGAVLDYESRAAYSVTVRASSIDGSYQDRAFTILVSNVNESPTAASHDFSVDNVSQLIVSSLNMMAGMSDPDGDPLQLQLLSGASHGVLSFQADGAFRYTPDSGFTGRDEFVVMASDGQLASAPATVTITVTLPNAVNGGGASSGSNGASGPANSSSGAGSDGGSALPQAVDTSLASGAPPGFATYTEDSAGGREAHRDAHGDASAAGEASALPERSLQVQQRASEG
ncbi:MAG: cadherin domain-containing protein, partial [Aureliella sp.]